MHSRSSKAPERAKESTIDSRQSSGRPTVTGESTSRRLARGYPSRCGSPRCARRKVIRSFTLLGPAVDRGSEGAWMKSGVWVSAFARREEQCPVSGVSATGPEDRRTRGKSLRRENFPTGRADGLRPDIHRRVCTPHRPRASSSSSRTRATTETFRSLVNRALRLAHPAARINDLSACHVCRLTLNPCTRQSCPIAPACVAHDDFADKRFVAQATTGSSDGLPQFRHGFSA